MSDEVRATYRIQLRPEFDLDEAANIIEYLARLGVSHLYASPYLQAAPGSAHGYNIVDYQRVNQELGGRPAQQRLVTVLQEQGMGQVLDIVPNHMAISPENPWWWDVLENGPSSRYASYFDVDWNPPEARYSDVVLIPVLGDHFGRVLEAGEIRLEYEDGHFLIRYLEHVYPVDPRSLSQLLSWAADRKSSDILAFLAKSYGQIPLATSTDRRSARQRYRDQAALGGILQQILRENPALERALKEVVAETNQDPDLLESFLDLQNYRLAYWKISERELGYRRFFDINTLIGLRAEDEEVFQDTHELILKWVHAGIADGLRIDHLDGLRDPAGYLERLRSRAPKTWIVVEKILEAGEDLPDSWPIAGTSGYDFLNRVNNLFVYSQNEKSFSDLYEEFTGETASFPKIVQQAKHQVMEEVLGSDVNRLLELFLQVTERHRRYRDYPRRDLRDVLKEVAACLRVYRTYARARTGEVSQRDQSYIETAIQAAKQSRPDLDPELFDFFGELLLLRVRGPVEDRLVMRFQQFTGPVMAKGVEDTAFYIYNRFISLNEVGGNPGIFGISAASFHQENAEIQANWPETMLATSTHDTKRSEDVRARLNVLSEIPEAWADAVWHWSAVNERHWGSKDSNLPPDRNAEYLLYQTLVGTWSISLERILGFMEKAIREAKRHTSWSAPDDAYEGHLLEFVRGVLDDREFMDSLKVFVDRLVEPGWINSLAQTLLKLTAPGIPDIYQGMELWDFSLVDPDNRQEVDFTKRRQLLTELVDKTPEEIWDRREEGLPKLWVITQALALRKRCPEIFAEKSSYRPLDIDEGFAVGFLRGERVATLVPRWSTRRNGDWGGQRVEIPAGDWQNVLTGEKVVGGSKELATIFSRFPVSLLVKNEIQDEV